MTEVPDEKVDALFDLLQVDEDPDWVWCQIRNGLEYGYPECCVMFFVTMWMRIADAFSGEGDKWKDENDMNDTDWAVFGVWADYNEMHGLDEDGFLKTDRMMCPACLLEHLKSRQPVPA